MKILVTADWHFHAYKAHSGIRDGMNSRLADIRDAWTEAVAIGVRNECQVMTVSGDLFHVRGQMKPSVVNVVQDLVHITVAHYGMKVVVIPGNHDMEDYRKGDTAVDFLGKMSGVSILDGGSCEFIEGVKFAGIPYQHNTKDFIEGAKFLMKSDPDIALIHQGIDDFKHTTMPDMGLTYDMVKEVFGDTPVFCGHYHMKGGRENIYQVGAPIQHTFNDEGQSRGVRIYDTGTKECVFHEVRSGPKFVTVESEADEWKDGDFIRVKTSDPKKADELVKGMRTAGDVTVIHVKEFKESERATIYPGPVLTMLENYIDVNLELIHYKKEIIELYLEVCV